MKRARQRRVRPAEESSRGPSAGIATSGVEWPSLVGIGLAAMVAVWATYHPADSVALQKGDALLWTIAVLVGVAVGSAVWGWRSRRAVKSDRVPDGGPKSNQTFDSIDGWLLLLAGWILLAGCWPVGADCLGGDRQAARSVAWFALAGVGWVVVARRWFACREAASMSLALVGGCGVLLAVHALHQDWISLPQTLRQYMADPGGTLRQMGVEAPAGSAARMIYENRLRDGGPTATFALANTLAGVLAMSAGLLIGWFGVWFSSDSAARSSGRLASMAGGVLGLLLMAVWTTHSRGAVLAVGAVALSTSFVTVNRKVAPLCKKIPASAVGAAVVLALVGLPLAVAAVQPLRAVPGEVAQTAINAAAESTGSDAESLETGAGSFTTGTEWWDQAPASVRYRLQYWRTTLAIVAERPWWGARPGNFQLVYQAYRDAYAHETVAEPHHFWFETLAAAGWPAGAVLACLVTAVVVRGWRAVVLEDGAYAAADSPADPTLSDSEPDLQAAAESPVRWRRWYVATGLGASITWVAVWAAAIRSGNVPDVEAHLIGTPLGVAAAIVISAGLKRCTHRQVKMIAAAGLATGLLHQSFSGGWAVPGAAWVVWTLVGVVTAKVAAASRLSRVAGRRVWMVGTAVFAVAGLAAYFVSYRPDATSKSAFRSAAAAAQQGLTRQTSELLERSLQRDPAAVEPAVWRLQWLWSRQVASIAARSSKSSNVELSADDPDWVTAVRAVERRIGNDPTRMRVIGDLFLHRYQIAGRADDLTAAWGWFAAALVRSPTHEALMAQVAEIRREASERQIALPQEFLVNGPAVDRTETRMPADFSCCGHADHLPDPTSASALARRAWQLGEAGGVPTRQLSRRFIAPARKLGTAAVPQADRAPAAEVLRWADQSP